jgi:putative transposase
VHAENQGVCGARKLWLTLNRERIPVARSTAARLMRDLGLAGGRSGKQVHTTIPEPAADRAPDRCVSLPLHYRQVSIREYACQAGRP